MVKKTVFALCLSILAIAGMVGGYFLLGPEGPDAPQQTVPESTVVFSSASEPAEIYLQNGAESYTVQATWNSDEAAVYSIARLASTVPLNQGYLKALATICTTLDEAELVEEAPTELSRYGLSSPITATISYRDGTAATLYIGADSSDGYHTYATASGDSVTGLPGAVYAVPTSKMKYFLMQPLDYVHPTVTQTNTGSPFFDSAVFQVGESPSIAFRRIPPTQEGEASGYTMVEPFAWPVGTDGILVFQQLSGLIATEAAAVFPDDAALEEYGLAEPYATAEIIGAQDGDYKLILSQPDEDNMLYLMRQGVPVVYRLSAEQLPWLNAEVFLFLNKTVSNPLLDDVSSVLLETPNAAYRFSITKTQDSYSVLLNGEAFDYQFFHPFYGTLTAGILEGLSEEPVGEDAPFLLRITFSYHEALEEDQITYYEGPPRKCIAVFSGGKESAMAWEVSSTYVDRILQDLAKVVSKQAVETFQY